MTVKSRLLELLEQHKGETLSGERLAEELACTRAAVWKAVKSLREEGYTIEAGPNKGYMLARDSNRLSVEGMRLYLSDSQVSVKIYEQLNSTAHPFFHASGLRRIHLLRSGNNSQWTNILCLWNRPQLQPKSRHDRYNNVNNCRVI